MANKNETNDIKVVGKIKKYDGTYYEVLMPNGEIRLVLGYFNLLKFLSENAIISASNFGPNFSLGID